MKYKVGDRVIVRTDLIGGRCYPFSDPFYEEELYFAQAMLLPANSLEHLIIARRQ